MGLARRGRGLVLHLSAIVAVSVSAGCSTPAPTGPSAQVPPPPPPTTGPTSIVVAGGDTQSAPAGSPVATAPRVRVSSQAGSGIAGVPVEFRVTSGGGSLESGNATTNAEGLASPGTWTLGPAGQQRLVATVAEVGSVTFTAVATATPSSIVASAGDGQTAPVGSAVATAPEVRVTDPTGAPIAGVAVTFTVDGGGGAISGGLATTDEDGRASVTSWRMGTATGPNALSAVIPGSGISGNPVTFTATATPGPAASISAAQGDGQTVPGGATTPIRPQVRVADVHGNGVPGIPVAFAVQTGGGSVTAANQTTGADGRATVGSWSVGPGAGANTLIAAAGGGGIASNPVTFTATSTGGAPGGGAYDIDVRFNPGSQPTGPQAAAFATAEGQWEAIVTGDLIDTPVDRPAGTCTSTVPINETVDDLVIYVTLEAIDGAGGVLGSAGPCLIRSGSLLSLVGQMRLDIADLANMEASGTLEEVIAHEMGHVLGVGSLWSALGLLVDPSLSGGTDPHFNGGASIAAFNAVGGAGHGGPKVPVENTGGSGTADSHWRETIFGSELMTGWIGPGSNPLSLVTVQSLADIGYTVDTGEAQAYSLPVSSLVVPAPGPGRAPLRMTHDVWRVPLEIISPSGISLGLIPR